jgi:N-acetylmuramoyl-L-alanine amidase
MRVQNHKLVDHWYKQSPNVGGALVNPTLLVIHFTASGGAGAKGDADYMSGKAAKVSAHVCVGRDGSVFQIVPFNQKAWHAGQSIWRGRRNCNDYAIGIEVDNWGKLVKGADGRLRSWTKEVIPPADGVFLKHKNETSATWWELYSQPQMEALQEVAKAILAAYPSIKEIVGHDDIAPGRKVDPGPAFPMARFISNVRGRVNSEVKTRKVIANLNARGGPGTHFDVVRVLPKGSIVQVVYEEYNGWAQLTTGEWVSDSYLA